MPSSLGHLNLDAYAEKHPQFGGTQRIPELLSNALVRSDPNLVLDLGCGEGGTLRELAHSTKGRLVIGLEGGRRRALIAKQANGVIVVGDGLKLPLEDNSVGLVICRHVIEHVADDARLAEEIHRVLRPAGALYLETPLRLRGAWYFYRNRLGRRVLDPTHLREYTSIDQVTRILAAAGLGVVAIQTTAIRYPLDELLKRVGRFHRAGSVRSNSPSRKSIRIPRYKEIRILAGKESSNTEDLGSS